MRLASGRAAVAAAAPGTHKWWAGCAVMLARQPRRFVYTWAGHRGGEAGRRGTGEEQQCIRLLLLLRGAH
jgi:hypothetical protein